MSQSKPVGIVAGGGGLVQELLEYLRNQNSSFHIAAIKGEADTNLRSGDVEYFNWGEIGRIIKYFKKNNCENLLLLGRIEKRPDFMSILGDPGTLKRVPKIIQAMRGGDDSLFQRVLRLIEDEGFKVIGIKELAPDFLLSKGLYGAGQHYNTHKNDITIGKQVLRDLGKHDIGQALVIHNGRILAVEGAEGTDNMLKRITFLRNEGRLSKKTPSGILLKGAKPSQDLRVDLPTIGFETVKLAKAAGLCGLVCEADRVLIAEKGKTLELIEKENLFLSCEGEF